MCVVTKFLHYGFQLSSLLLVAHTHIL